MITKFTFDLFINIACLAGEIIAISGAWQKELISENIARLLIVIVILLSIRDVGKQIIKNAKDI
jgi:hypothetical protein